MHVLSAHQRVLAIIGGLGLAAAVSIGLIFARLQTWENELGDGYGTKDELSGLASQLLGVTRDGEESLGEYLLTGDSDSLARLRAATDAETGISGQITDAAADQPEIADAMAGVTTATEAWRANVADPSIASVQQGHGMPGSLPPGYARYQDTTHLAIQRLAHAIDGYSVLLDLRNEGLTAARTTTTTASFGATLLAAIISLWFVRRYGRALERDVKRSDILSRFTEVTTSAPDDQAVATSTLAALALLAHANAAVMHLLNPSQDRAVPEAVTGALAEVVPLKALSGCPGIVRGSIYVASDASAALSVHCPVFPVERGTLACIPLRHSETVGVVHLHWDRANAFPLDLRASVAQVAEHAALAIGNRRLLALLEGQAGTDARTGLANSRTFDAALENKLKARLGDDQLAVLMLDLDHFKDLNDRYGHPAGDEALRIFAGVLRSCMRGGDIAARYGGEEFAVLLPGVDEATAVGVAERIRSRTESTIISLGPGISDRITVSIGVAMAPQHASERVSLLQIADAALYQAKDAGRNMVRVPGSHRAANPRPQRRVRKAA